MNTYGGCIYAYASPCTKATTCKICQYKPCRFNPLVLRRCCDCANQGTKLRYQCKHSGGLIPIECESFIDARFKECLYCKLGHEFKRSIFCLCDSEELLWDTPEMLLDIKCSCFEPKKQKTDSWIDAKAKLPPLFRHIEVKSLHGIITDCKIRTISISECGVFAELCNRGGLYISCWRPFPDTPKPEKTCDTCDTRSYPRKGFCIHVNKCIQNNYSCWILKSEKGKLGFYADDRWLYFDDGRDVQECVRVDDTTVNEIANWLNAIGVSTGRHKKG